MPSSIYACTRSCKYLAYNLQDIMHLTHVHVKLSGMQHAFHKRGKMLPSILNCKSIAPEIFIAQVTNIKGNSRRTSNFFQSSLYIYKNCAFLLSKKKGGGYLKLLKTCVCINLNFSGDFSGFISHIYTE